MAGDSLQPLFDFSPIVEEASVSNGQGQKGGGTKFAIPLIAGVLIAVSNMKLGAAQPNYGTEVGGEDSAAGVATAWFVEVGAVNAGAIAEESEFAKLAGIGINEVGIPGKSLGRIGIESSDLAWEVRAFFGGILDGRVEATFVEV